MKKKISLILVSLLGFCAISCTCVSVAVANHPQNVVAVYAEGEEQSSEPAPETSQEQEPAIVEEQPAEQVDEVKEWLDKWMSPQMIAMYMSWLAYLGTIIGLVANIKKLKQTNNLTLKNVSDEIADLLKKLIGEEVANQFSQIAPKLLKGQEDGNKIMTIFAKILALSQENTPESKVAILNLIEELGCVGKEVVENAKEIVKQGVELEQKAKEEIEKKVDEIIDQYDGTAI